MKEKVQAPELRFDGFTDDWELRKLGSLTTVVRGASPRPIQDPKWFDKESDIGWLRIADVTEQNGRIYHLEQHISKLGQEKTRVLTEPHLLLSIAATVGKPVVNYVKTGVHDGFLIFLNPTFEREFMFQWLEMFRPKWQKYGQPGSQVNLNSELVRNQEIVLPNYKEQQKIGSFFKQLDDTIVLHQRKLDLLKEQKKGFLQKMFPKNGAKVPELRFAGFADDWEERKFSDFTKLSQGLQIAISDRFTEAGPNKEFYITNEFLNPNNTKKYYIENPSKNVIANKNDILMTRTGNTGKVVTNTKGAFHNNFFKIDYDPQKISKLFLYFLLTSIPIQKEILIRAGTSTIPDLNHKDFYNIKVYLPIFEEQQRIGSFFKQLDDTIALHQRKLDLLKEQKKGFLQKMFV